MNFFFGIKKNNFYSKINIPKFNNDGKLIFGNHSIYKCTPENNLWKVSEYNCPQNEEFFFIQSEFIDNHSIFFIARKEELGSKNNEFYLNELKNFNKITDKNVVEFRSNLNISLENGGTSSYQSEYSYKMATKNGSILSPLDVLLDKNADKNFLIFKNIYIKPFVKKHFLYLINKNKREIIERYEVFSNTTNLIQIKNEYIGSNLYLFTKDLLGIPLYLSVMNNHLSLEHTHPPLHYLFGKNALEIVNNVKKEFKSIINEKIF
jgi:hypothetical protein